MYSLEYLPLLDQEEEEGMDSMVRLCLRRVRSMYDVLSSFVYYSRVFVAI